MWQKNHPARGACPAQFGGRTECLLQVFRDIQSGAFAGYQVDVIFPLPPLAEQQRIVAEVERRLSVVEEVEAALTANLQYAERLR